MSDKTFGVKVSEEIYDKVKNMIDISGISSKEWFEKVVAVSEVQSLKDGSGDYKQDLTELEKHTTRIYELVANMIQRANYLKDDAMKVLKTKLESRELTISELQGNVKTLKDELKRKPSLFAFFSLALNIPQIRSSKHLLLLVEIDSLARECQLYEEANKKDLYRRTRQGLAHCYRLIICPVERPSGRKRE